MISIDRKVIQGLPILELVDNDICDQCLPTVFYYHGWTQKKETSLEAGYGLATNKLRVILPEALFHGERRDELPTEAHITDFWKIIMTSLVEFKVLSDYFIKQGLTDSKRIGVSGMSMGGITTCGLAQTYPEINSFACLMGTPYYVEFAKGLIQQVGTDLSLTDNQISDALEALLPYDLSKTPENIAGRPFYFWHGRTDDQVPFLPTYNFYQKIKTKEYGKKAQFTVTEGGHKVPRAIFQEMADFFVNQL